MKNILLVVSLLVSFLEAKTYTMNATFVSYDCGDSCYATFKSKGKNISLMDEWDRENFWSAKENQKFKVTYTKKKEYYEPAGEEISFEILESVKQIKSKNVWKNEQVVSDEYPQLKAILFASMDHHVKIGVVMASSACKKYDSKLLNAPDIIFNNRAVKMYAQCIDKNMRMDFPATDKGMKYLMNEFTRKNSVTGKQDNVTFTFSARGFSKAKRAKLQEIKKSK